MVIKFGESGHPVFRATSPLSRGTLKSKGGENYLYTTVPMVIRLELFSHNHFFQSAQYPRSSLRIV